jgi:hypothetical protein
VVMTDLYAFVVITALKTFLSKILDYKFYRHSFKSCKGKILFPDF